MNDFKEIKDAIYSMYTDTFDCIYNKKIEVYKTDSIYKIILPQNNDVTPINLFIEADNDEDCKNQVLKDLSQRCLWRTSYNKLKRVKVGNG